MYLDLKEWSSSENWVRVNANILLKDMEDDAPKLQPQTLDLENFINKLDVLVKKEYITEEERENWLHDYNVVKNDDNTPWCLADFKNFQDREYPQPQILSSNLSYVGGNLIITNIPYFGTRKNKTKRVINVNNLVVAIKNKSLVIGIVVSPPNKDITLAVWEKRGEKYSFSNTNVVVRKDSIIGKLNMLDGMCFTKKTEEVLTKMRKVLALNEQVFDFAESVEQLQQAESDE